MSLKVTLVFVFTLTFVFPVIIIQLPCVALHATAHWHHIVCPWADQHHYVSAATVPMIESNHNGEDVILYARGPHAHLFTGIHENAYIPHAIRWKCQLKYSLAQPPTRTSTSPTSSGEHENFNIKEHRHSRERVHRRLSTAPGLSVDIVESESELIIRQYSVYKIYF